MERRAFTAVIVSTTRQATSHTGCWPVKMKQCASASALGVGRVFGRVEEDVEEAGGTTNDEQRTNGVITRAS